MQPHPLLLAKCSHGRQRIHGPAHGGAGRGHHGDHRDAKAPLLGQRLGQGLHIQAAASIHRDGQQGPGRQPHHRHRLIQRRVGVGAGQHHRIWAAGQTSGAPGGHQGHQVGQSAAAGGYPATASGHAQPLGQPGAYLPLQLAEAGGELL